MTRRMAPPRERSAGFTVIEILVAIVLLALGLLGVLGLQTRASAVEFESYQRGQALALARDMQARLLSSRGLLPGYLDGRISSTDGSLYVGAGNGAANFLDGDGNCLAPVAGDTLTEARFQLCTWGLDLQGLAQTEGANAVGAMIGARGCVIRINPPQLNALADLYVVVVWQGVAERAEPPADSPSAQCASDVDYGRGMRRAVSVRVLVPDLRKGA